MDGFAIRLLHRLARHDAEEAGSGRATPVARTVEASVQPIGRDDGAQSAGRQESGTALAEWRQVWIALPIAVSPSPLHLEWRERDEPARANGLGRRFLINVRLTRLGALELDGLMSDSGDRFDLIVRSEAMLPPAVRSGVRQMFETALDILAARGGLAFKAEGQHETAPGRCDRQPSAAGVVV
ncbi:MAG: hypothetical protein WAS73_07820 [Defluviicoccus sp.]